MTWVINQSTSEEARQLGENLVAFNRLQVPFTQDPGRVELNLHIKDDQQRIIAGINSVLDLLAGTLHRHPVRGRRSAPSPTGHPPAQ